MRNETKRSGVPSGMKSRTAGKMALLVLLVSAMTTAARADALVYTMKDRSIYFTNDSQGPEIAKESVKGYVIFEASPGSASMNMWVITTQNYAGVKYADVELRGTLSVIVKEKTMVISAANDSRSIFLAGRSKIIAINGKNFDVAGTLKGMLIWDYIDSVNPGYRNVGCEKVALSFNKKLTAVCKDYGGEAATEAILIYLKFGNMYIPVPG